MDFVVNVDGLGGAQDFGNEVLLVRLAGQCDIGLCENILEDDDLECFAGSGGEQGAREGERGTYSLASMVVVAGGEGGLPEKAMGGA